MTMIRREIVISVEEDIEEESIVIGVDVPPTLTTLEAVGLMEIAKNQHLMTRHHPGPTIFQAVNEEAPRDE